MADSFTEGKSCFNFTSVDEPLFAELEELRVRALEAFQKLPYMKGHRHEGLHALPFAGSPADAGLSRFIAHMPLDDYEFRPITFQGVTFPATLMGISVLESVLGLQDEDLSDWLWRLPICRGFSMRTAAERCCRCARQAADLMLEHRQRVLVGIRDRLASHGFEPEATYRDWLLALQRIAELSAATEGECVWSASSHPRDTLKSEADVRRFIDALNKHETGNT